MRFQKGQPTNGLCFVLGILYMEENWSSAHCMNQKIKTEVPPKVHISLLSKQPISDRFVGLCFYELGLALWLQLMCFPSFLPNVLFKETKWVCLLGQFMLPFRCITILNISFACLFGREKMVQLWTFYPTLHISPMQEHYSVLTWILDANSCRQRKKNNFPVFPPPPHCCRTWQFLSQSMSLPDYVETSEFSRETFGSTVQLLWPWSLPSQAKPCLAAESKPVPTLAQRRSRSQGMGRVMPGDGVHSQTLAPWLRHMVSNRGAPGKLWAHMPC